MLTFSEWLTEAIQQDFFNLANLQRGEPEHAMLKFQHLMAGGIMNSVIEHVGDLTHRMSERPTFAYAGYEYVKDKVEKTLRWLTNEYGFEREFEENIRNNAVYLKIDEEEFRRKLYAALEEYSREHEKLPTFNRAQTLAKTAAVSLGRRQFTKTIRALEMLSSHLQTREEWTVFAHQGLE